MDLEEDPNQVRSRFHSTHRRNIKIAEKSGIQIRQGSSEQHLREFYRLHLMTRQRQGMPTQPWRFFKLLGKLLLEKDLGFIILAYQGEECVAASVFLKWKKTLMYKYGASTPTSLQYRPNNLVMWTAIRWGCENGFTVFDMGRTDNENTGLRQFKCGWGAQETPLAYTVLSQKPEQEGVGNFQHLIQKIIQNSPIWVSQLTGQLFYRYFG
jgi:lipid II:glycine glycyltransferase (peptidoglycan interpeptide bridge formation enzyme)